MIIKKEDKELIVSVIKENPKYRGNEDITDVFVEAVYAKSYLLIDAIRDKQRVKRHLSAICDSCMSQVLGEKRKFVKNQLYRKIEQNNTKMQDNNSIVSLKKRTPLDYNDEQSNPDLQKIKNNIVNLKEEIQRSEKYDKVDTLIDPLEYCPQKRISERTLDKLITLVKRISDKFPKKRYYEIFSLRYIRRYNQTEIAREMKISQVELSKRFVELIRLTRESF